jgi:hypothetical protein
MHTTSVSPGELQVGKVYWALTFIDDALTIPELQPRVFIGVDLVDGDNGLYYFQDAASYFAKIGGLGAESGAVFSMPADSLTYTFHFEGALERLRLCEDRRNAL